MFEILGVKRANYYKWLKHSKTERDLENEELAGFVRKYDKKFNHTLGYRMMTDRINRDENKNYNDKCKSQYKNVGFGQYKNVGFPTFLYWLFSLHPLGIEADL